jgi:hypothetical protein
MVSWLYISLKDQTQDASFGKGFSMPEENRGTPRLLNTETSQTDAITTRKSPAIKLISALNRKSAGDVSKNAISKPIARKPS